MKRRITTYCVLFLVAANFTKPLAAQSWDQAGNSLLGTEKLGSLNNQPVNMVTNNTSRLYIAAAGKIGIGTTLPVGYLTVKGPGSSPSSAWGGGLSVFTGFGEGNTGSADFLLSLASDLSGARPIFLGRRARGTLAAPTVPQVNDYLSSFIGSGFDGTSFQLPASVDFFVDGAPSAGNVPARIAFSTGSNGSTRAQRLKIGSTGDIAFNNNQMFLQQSSGTLVFGTTIPNASAILDINSTTKGMLTPRMNITQRNAISSPATGLLIYQTNSTPGFYYFDGMLWQPISSSVASGANTTLSNLTSPTAVNTDLLPGTTAATDLGSSSKEWRSLYLNGDANLSAGNLNFSSSLQTIQFPTVPTTTNNPMINMFSSGTVNNDRMVIAHSPAYPNWGLQYQDAPDKFNFLSGGTPVLTADLGNWRVGVGTSSPGARLDIAGTGSFDLANTEGDFRLGDATYRLKMGVANSGGGAGDAYIASANRLYLGAGSTLSSTQTVSINSNGTVGIGTFSPNARLQVVGDAAVTSPGIQSTISYVGSADVRGISSYSKTADGWGYGVEGTGGFIGGYFSGSAATYTGTGFGVYGTASGTAGTRIGVYGAASGGTVNNWGGYFPTKTYTSELRVGGETGATGYVAAINGKLIATEVRVELVANWPDYVFNRNYKLLSLEDLEAKINAENHLPGVPAASEIKENGIMLGEMQTKTMEKVEENTLYILQLNKKMKDDNEQLTNKIKELERIINELSKKIK